MDSEQFALVTSTIDIAEKYIQGSKYPGHFLIVAEEQSESRGRNGSTWYSPRGGLWFSLVLHHLSMHKSFTLYIGCCVLRALIEVTKIPDFQIKWPNDIYLHNEKICGLICSRFIQHQKTHIGIGVNTNNELKSGFSPLMIKSIQKLLNITIDNKIYLATILEQIFSSLDEYETQGSSLFRDYYFDKDYLKGKKIQITSGMEIWSGWYQGLNQEGNLVLEDENGKKRIICSGSVTI